MLTKLVVKRCKNGTIVDYKTAQVLTTRIPSVNQFSCATPATRSSAFIRSTTSTWKIRANGKVQKLQKLKMTFPGQMAHRQAVMVPMNSKSNSMNWNGWLSKLLLKQRLLQLLQMPLNPSIGILPMQPLLTARLLMVQLGLIPLLAVLPGPLSIQDVELSGSITRSWIS